MTCGDGHATTVLDIFRLLFPPFYIQIQDSAHLAFTGRLRYLYSSCLGYRCCHRGWVPVRQQDCVFSGLRSFRIPGTSPEKIAAFGASFIRSERTSLFNLLVAAQLVQDARGARHLLGLGPPDEQLPLGSEAQITKIGRASCRERV